MQYLKFIRCQREAEKEYDIGSKPALGGLGILLDNPPAKQQETIQYFRFKLLFEFIFGATRRHCTKLRIH